MNGCDFCGDENAEAVWVGRRPALKAACAKCDPAAHAAANRCPIDRVQFVQGAFTFRSVADVNSVKWWRDTDHSAALAEFHAQQAEWKRNGRGSGMAAPWDGQITGGIF